MSKTSAMRGIIFKIRHGVLNDGSIYFDLDRMHIGLYGITRQLSNLNNRDGLADMLMRDYIEFVVLDDIESNPYNAELPDPTTTVASGLSYYYSSNDLVYQRRFDLYLSRQEYQ